MGLKRWMGIIGATVAVVGVGLSVPARELYELQLARVQLEEAMRTPPIFDSSGRLAWHRGKTEVPCPEQVSGDGSLVLLLIGQSNTANHAEKKVQTAFGRQVINYYNDRCYTASSPLLGATGSGGESWTILADELVSRKMAKQVVLVPIGIDGSTVSRWAANGDLYAVAATVIRAIRHRYRITHILWHQGETDFKIGTSQRDYAERLMSMIDGFRSMGIEAPVYVSIASKCTTEREWHGDNPVARAQHKVIDRSRLILPGVNTDLLIQEQDRHDGCHFSHVGQWRFAQAWREVLSQHLPTGERGLP